MAPAKSFDDQPIIIIGAGPTGIGAALRLQEHGVPWLMLEKSGHPGGLSASFSEQGFLWDIGGHVIFSHYEAYDKLLEAVISPDQWCFHPRNAQVRIDECWVPYPFQLNLDKLPAGQQRQCSDGLARVQGQDTDYTNFASYIDSHFGEGIAKLFMRPYNRKIWACELEQMSTDWLGERVAAVVEKPATEEKPDKWGPNRDFRYPKQGGTGAIWNSAAGRLDRNKLRLGNEVVHIDRQEHVLRISTGEQIRYSALINTMPVDRLCQVAEITSLEQPIGELRYTSVHVVGLGLASEVPDSIAEFCWLYFPDPDCPFYRATILSRYSENNAPAGHCSLMLEISESDCRPVSAKLIEDCIESCLKLGLINARGDIVQRWHYRAEYGYPVPTLGRDDALRVINRELELHDIYSRGRFGAWKYEVGNMDHSYMQGREVADRLVRGSRETVVNHLPGAERG